MSKLFYLLLFSQLIGNFCYSQLPGELDISFGTNGKIIHPSPIYTNGIQSMAQQTDGKTLAVGSCDYKNYFVMRLNSDGSIDNSFGQNGIVKDSLLGEAYGNDVKVDGSGRILVTGYIRHWNAGWLKDMFVVRLLEDGSYDPTFGENGIFVSHVSQPLAPTKENYGKKIIILNDGTILIGGIFDLGTTVNPDFAVFKITESGQFDSSFGSNGYVYYHLSGMDALTDIFLQNDGNILLTGSTFNPVIVSALRLNPNGSLDNTFGTSGIVSIDFGTSHQAGISILQLNNGNILLSGYRGASTNLDYFITRLETNGQIDNSFGVNGFNFFDNGSAEGMRSMTLLPDNNIILTGSSAGNMLFVCYDSLGLINNSFANNGNLIIDFSGYTDNAFCSLLQSDGKLVVSGLSSGVNNSRYYPFARLYSTYSSLFELDLDKGNFSIFPNPAKETMTIKIPDENNSYNSCSLIDASGREIKQIKLTCSETHIDILDLNPGIYFLKIGDWVQKLVVE